MNRIHELDKNTINLIAAGEVVIDPSSVVKEVVENSVDAGSTYVKVEIQNGGKSLIRVTDNGHGIYEDDIELAFKRNATSKFHAFDSIDTLGFRGEALASIVSVANVTLTTKTADSTLAVKVSYSDGELVKKQKIAGKDGTVIEVTGLFQNVPARYKHLKNSSEESSKVTNIVRELASANPDVTFVLYCDNKEIFTTYGDGDKRKLLSLLYTPRMVNQMNHIEFDDDPLHFEGYLQSSNFIGNGDRLSLLVLNGRIVDMPKLSKVIDIVYTDLYGRKGASYIIYLDLPFSMIDVNIHPSKKTVSFINESLIFMIIRQGIKDSLTETFKLNEDISKVKFFEDPISAHIEETTAYFPQDETKKEETQEYFYANEPVLKDTVDRYTQLPDKNKLFRNETFSVKTVFESDDIEEDKSISELGIRQIDRSIFTKLSNSRYIGMAFGLYAMFECDKDIYAIDTHAADERVLYDEYMESFKKNQINMQDYLVPRVISLDMAKIRVVEDNKDVFEKLGFDIEAFDESNIIIRAVPVYLAELGDIDERIYSLIDVLSVGSANIDDSTRDMKLIRTACHNAFRGASNIDQKELNLLLERLSTTTMPFTCPHGRPIIGRLNITNFMKVFDRIK